MPACATARLAWATFTTVCTRPPARSSLPRPARFWFERTLAMRQPERGIAGYAAWMPSLAGNQEGWVDDPGVLTGAAGIALALLAATTTIEPEWDRMLLVSVPPRRATA